MPNAIEMLRDDHRKVKQLFDEFEHAEDRDGNCQDSVMEPRASGGGGDRRKAPQTRIAK